MMKSNGSTLNLKIVLLLMLSAGIEMVSSPSLASPKAPPLNPPQPTRTVRNSNLQDQIHKLEQRMAAIEQNLLKINQQLNKLLLQKGATPVTVEPPPIPYSDEWRKEQQQERLDNMFRRKRLNQ